MAAALAVATGCAAAAAPAGSAVAQAEWVLDRLNRGGVTRPEVEQHFSPAFLRMVMPADAVAGALNGARAERGPFRVRRYARPTTASEAIALVTGRQEPGAIRVRVAQGKIEALELTAPPPDVSRGGKFTGRHSVGGRKLMLRCVGTGAPTVPPGEHPDRGHVRPAGLARLRHSRLRLRPRERPLGAERLGTDAPQRRRDRGGRPRSAPRSGCSRPIRPCRALEQRHLHAGLRGHLPAAHGGPGARRRRSGELLRPRPGDPQAPPPPPRVRPHARRPASCAARGGRSAAARHRTVTTRTRRVARAAPPEGDAGLRALPRPGAGARSRPTGTAAHSRAGAALAGAAARARRAGSRRPAQWSRATAATISRASGLGSVTKAVRAVVDGVRRPESW